MSRAASSTDDSAMWLRLDSLLGTCRVTYDRPIMQLVDGITGELADMPDAQDESFPSQCLAKVEPVVPATYDGKLSPRGGTTRYVPLIESQDAKETMRSLLLLTPDDIVAQIYVQYDEDVTKLIINVLDEVTLASDEPNRVAAAKEEAVNKLVTSLGDKQMLLIQAMVNCAKQVLTRLLEEFCTLPDAASSGGAPQGASSNSTFQPYGATVRFVGGKGEKLGEHERWLKHMNRRYVCLIEESELNAILKKDFSMSGAVLPANTLVTKSESQIRFFVPAMVPAELPENQKLAIATGLPPWTHPAFHGVTHLNTIQTKVFETAFHSSQNLLICAPTGAGKTMVALLVMLRQMQEQIVKGKLDRDFKIIYIAPMKALAQEMVRNFQKRLQPFLIVVRELTGDMQLTKREIEETQLIITTPEKWDVVTRKQADNDIVKKTKLIIIDEIHLLNDDRGPVIEAIVARTLRIEEAESSQRIRLVGLSATLPNVKDVAVFLRVNVSEGLKVFGPEYRPVPLEQTFIGVTESQRNIENAIDRVAYQEVVKNLREGHQVMVFVHARKQTINFGKFMCAEAQKRGDERWFRQNLPEAASKQASKLQGRDLYTLFEGGVCAHHAGLIRFDRTLVENLFREGHFKVLVCTSTLAWGVNLPAHTVIIRGTQIYDPKYGKYISLSVLDVMQIFGRAGRPQYDTSGHGIIISEAQDVQQYVRLIAHALPIESKLQSRLSDHLNAEVHSGTVSSVADGVRWLEYTYLWQRIRTNPLAYGLTVADVRKDPELRAARYGIVCSAAATLQKAMMVRYNEDTGALDTTDMGRVASHYYIEHVSITTFNDILRKRDGSFTDTITMGEALNCVSNANEFSQLRARAEELDELSKLNAKLPKQVQEFKLVKESVDDTSIQFKVVTLLKAYITRLGIEAHSLQADVNYVVQNASRIARALFEIEVMRCHPQTALVFLTICKSVDRRCWDFQHPLMQFDVDFTDAVLNHLNTRRPSMATLQDMSEREIGDLVHNLRFGGVIRSLVNHFPSLEISIEVQPITRTILRLKVTLVPNFVWHDRYHGGAEHFWLFVEDQDNNLIFHHEQIILKKRNARKQDPIILNLTIPIMPDYDTYCVRVYSDRWLRCEEEAVFSLSHLHLPDDSPPNTKLLPLSPLHREVIPQPFVQIFSDFAEMNAVQSQTFHCLYHTDANVLLGAPTGSGKTICAEMAMLRILENKKGKIIYIAPLKALVKERLRDWRERYAKTLKYGVVELSGDVTPDINALTKADIVCTTPEKWDGISRNWQSRSYVQEVALVIFDEIHMLGTDRGPILEVIVSRMRYIGWHKGKQIRLIGLSTATANPVDLAAWLGVDKKWALFNFEPSVRPVPMRCFIAGYPGKNYCPRMATMNKPVYNAIVEKSPTKPVIVFVSSRRQTRLTAIAIINYLLVEKNTAKFVRMSAEEVMHTLTLIEDPHLKHCAQFGIGMHHAGLPQGDKAIVEDLFRNGKIQILIATSTLAWGVNFPAHLVIVKGTEFYDAKTKSYVDYPITDVLQMIGRAGRPQFDTEGIAQVLCHEPKKSYYRKFLYDPFPVESALHKNLHAHINAEIVAGTIATRQDAVDYLTWTYMFRRLIKNPSFYGLEDPSPRALTVFLSTLVRRVLADLEAARCIEPPSDEADESADPSALVYTTLGKLCSYYYLSHITASVLDVSVQSTTQHAELLRLLSEATEYAELPVRHCEDQLNLELAQLVPLPIDPRNAESPHVKAFLLFQAHFARAKLPISDYVTDLKSAIDNSVRIIQAMVDITANNGHLFTALRIMSLLQCMVQARWWHEHTLLQLPHINQELIRALSTECGVNHISDFANATLATLHKAEATLHKQELGLSSDHAEEVMEAVRHLPLIEVQVAIDRIPEEDGEVRFVVYIELIRLTPCHKAVVAPKFPKAKDEQFWLVLGHEPTGELIAIKRVNRLFKRSSSKLEFTWDDDWTKDTASRHTTLQLYVVCDSYMGLDQQYSLNVSLTPEASSEPAPPAA